MKPKLTFLLLISFISDGIASNRWPNHDISTLKLLQIVHRHGDRAPTDYYFPPNDPYKQDKYWPLGLGELTAQGRYKMYCLGQFIRKEYHKYLGEEYSAREVYARSSLTDRCFESAACLLAGAYPPLSQQWQWSNKSELGRIWQPIPIHTFMPRYNDILLNLKNCSVCDHEMTKAHQSKRVNDFMLKFSDLFNNLSYIVGRDINSITAGHYLHDVFQIEISFGYYWSHVWSVKEEQTIVDQLYYSHLMSYTIGWESPTIKRLRAGGLVKELIGNMKKVVNNTNDKKLYVYSTHDIIIIALLHALNVFDHTIPPFGTALLIELHQHKQLDSTGSSYEYFIRIFYFNETLTGSPYAIELTDCQSRIDCPLDMFIDSTKQLIYDDFDKECQS